MRSSIIAAAAFSALVSASSTANPFSNPSGGYVFTAGDATTLTWEPTTSGTVSLRLQWGSVTTAESGEAIASDIDNSGTFTWEVPTDMIKGQEYTIEILDDSDSNDYNFLPYFTVAGATATASATATATSISSSASTSSESTSTSSASSSSSTSTSSSSSASTTSTSTKTAATTMSTVTSTSASAKSTAATASSTSTSSSSSSASSTAAQTSVPTNAAGMTRVSAGMLAVVAGAAALL